MFSRNADVIVEVCHPQIVKDFGGRFLSHAHFLVMVSCCFILGMMTKLERCIVNQNFFFFNLQVGSPSALSDSQLNEELRLTAKQHGHTLYVPSGALWGGQDIQRLNDSGLLKVRRLLLHINVTT